MSSTVPCPSCGERVVAGSKYCPACGADVRASQAYVDTLEVVESKPTPIPKPDELIGALRDATRGEFEIYGQLGRGGMATVFLAHEIALGRKVAIKVMHPYLLYGEGMSERFKREAKTAGGLSHPHIIPIHAVRETDRLLFFVMQHVEGRALDSIIKELGPLPVKMVQTIVAHVGGALTYAHRKGVVHRDIKPANIMIDADGWAVVTDFGIAKVQQATGLTSTGAAVGTPNYMSPEQCTNGKITSASDQYSLGISAYEMLTGKPPFSGSDLMEIMRAHLFQHPAPIASRRPDCPPSLARAVTRMLEKDPTRRWPSLEEAVAAIGAAPLEQHDPIRTQMVELARSGAHSRPSLRARLDPGSIPRSSTRKLAHRTPVPNRPRPSIPRTSARSVAWRSAIWWVSAGALLASVVAVAILALPHGSSRGAGATLAPQQKQPAAPSILTGKIQIETQTREAELFIDGRNQGRILGSKTISLRAARVALRLAARGCASWDTVLSVPPGNLPLSLGRRDLNCKP